MKKEAWVTMVITSDYCPGAIVLAHSLRGAGNTSRPLLCMVSESLPEDDVKLLGNAGMQVVVVPSIAAPTASHVEAWDRVGYTKLNLWGLEEWDTIVYIDADCLVVGSMEELFQRDVDFAACPDTFPPDRFNAGVMVVRPSSAVLHDMTSKISTLSSYDGGDTGFLNAYFPDWYSASPSARLPFRFNALRTMYSMTKKKPGYWEAIGDLACIHMCSFPKPWQRAPIDELDQKWWVQYAQGISMPAMRSKQLGTPNSGATNGKVAREGTPSATAGRGEDACECTPSAAV